MNDNLKKSIMLRLASVAKALNKNHMEATVIESKEELLEKIKKLITYAYQ